MTFIHFWPIVILMIFSVVLGFIWYGPLFGKQWMALSGIAMPETKPSNAVMLKPILLSVIGAFFMAFALSSSIAFHNAYYQTSGVASGISMASLLWLGFIVPIYFNFSGWEGKSWKLFFINTGYWLVFLLVGAILIAS